MSSNPCLGIFITSLQRICVSLCECSVSGCSVWRRGNERRLLLYLGGCSRLCVCVDTSDKIFFFSFFRPRIIIIKMYCVYLCLCMRKPYSSTLYRFSGAYCVIISYGLFRVGHQMLLPTNFYQQISTNKLTLCDVSGGCVKLSQLVYLQ